MALNIKDPETDQLARRLSTLTGESITMAVKTAVRERIERDERTRGKASIEELMTIAKRIASRIDRDGARGFPANVNVAAALSLAGIGPERIRLEIWADPGVSRNTHRIVVEADAARFEMQIENVPTDENPRTGRITALSVIAALRRLTATLSVGS